MIDLLRGYFHLFMRFYRGTDVEPSGPLKLWTWSPVLSYSRSSGWRCCARDGRCPLRRRRRRWRRCRRTSRGGKQKPSQIHPLTLKGGGKIEEERWLETPGISIYLGNGNLLERAINESSFCILCHALWYRYEHEYQTVCHRTPQYKHPADRGCLP